MKFALTCFLLILTTHTNAITVDEAYASIPHKRTRYDASHLPAQEFNALKNFFALVDQAIVIKVEASNGMFNNDPDQLNDSIKDYDVLISEFAKLPTPSSIQPAQAKILHAIKLHQAYFKHKQQAHDKSHPYEMSFTPEVHEASSDLRQAYSLLLQAYPQDTPNNKTAYYDYLCTLDFI